MPAAFNAISVRAMLTARSSGMVSSAPDAALASAPVSSGALRSWVITAATPNAAAERRMAPTLRGSVTWSSTISGPGAVQRLLQAGRPERVGEQRGALVRDVAAEQMVEPAALHLLGRQRPRRRLALGEGLLRLLCQHEVAEAAGRVGERRGHRVQAVEPEGAAWRVRTVAVVALAVAMLVVLRAVVERLPLRAGPCGRLNCDALAALAVALIGAPLLAVAALALVARGTAAAAAAVRRRPPGAAMAIGVGRFHRPRV